MQNANVVALDMKPNWGKAPRWADYFAVDLSGVGRWYEAAPKKSLAGYWYAETPNRQMSRLAGIGFDSTSWRNSLEERPE